MSDLRTTIQTQVQRLVGGAGTVDLSRPPGDPGLFGPGSVTWRVHADFTAMMTGGIASLLMQMLHPAALAGVWDHSQFRRDMHGRLRRTAQFLAGTTYGSTDTAERLIARVRHIHDRVTGTLPDGTAYAANDPALLTWVHAAEVSSFLAAHRRYREPAMSGADADRYLAEMAEVARRLGAAEVPVTRSELDGYFADVRPHLRVDTRTRTVARSLLSQQPHSLALAPMQVLMMEGGIDLLPQWAQRLHGLERPRGTRPAIRAGMAGVGQLLRWALTDGAASRAARS